MTVDMASRHNRNKVRISLVPFEVIAEVAKALMFGAAVHGLHNWRKGMSWSEVADSLLRHYTAWESGEDRDPETGLYHLSLLLCNGIFLLYYQLHGLGLDDRFRREIPALTYEKAPAGGGLGV